MSGDPLVMQAIQAVQARYTLEEWTALPPSQITTEIYQELRLLDLQQAQTSIRPLSRATKAA